MERFLVAVIVALFLRSANSHEEGSLAVETNDESAYNGSDINLLSKPEEVNNEQVSGNVNAVLESLDQSFIYQAFEQLSDRRRRSMKRSLRKLHDILKDNPVGPIISRIIAIADETAPSSGSNGELNAEMKENFQNQPRCLFGRWRQRSDPKSTDNEKNDDNDSSPRARRQKRLNSKSTENKNAETD